VLRRRDDRDRLVEELRDRIQSLERRLDEAEASRRRADDTIKQFAQANTALPKQRKPEVPKQEEADASAPRPWWGETLKTTLPTVVAPVVTAAVAGFGSILAAVEGATLLAVGSFGIAMISAVSGVYFGVRRQVEARQQRLLGEAVAKAAAGTQAAAAEALAETQAVRATAEEALAETQAVKASAEEARAKTIEVAKAVEEVFNAQEETREGR
jgi:hypothetical protein